jgi:hypothetical protein
LWGVRPHTIDLVSEGGVEMHLSFANDDAGDEI